MRGRPVDMGGVNAPAETAPAPTAPQTKRVSRDDVVTLGRAGRPWEFLPVVAQVLKVAPGDAGLRFLAATNLARLGLVTAARGQLDVIGGAGGADVAALRDALQRLPTDVVPFETLAGTCRANVGALAERGVDLRGQLGPWEAEARNRQFLRSLDGNILRREVASDAGDLTAWQGLSDLAGAARAFVGEHFKEGTTERPCVIEGIDPPWLLREIHRATPARKDGTRQRLTVVQISELEFLNGLCQGDLRELIADPHIRFIVGPGAGERLGEDLRSRFEYRIVGPCIPLTTVKERISPRVDAIVRDACIEQQKEMSRLRTAVGAVYAGRDERWWSGRYRRAMTGEVESGGRHEPLRVLVPTCRYSTFIQHSSRDLVGAFQKAGCDARLMIEPDDSSHFSALAYQRQMIDFRPDLVILINHTRTNIGDFIPAEVPWVCWIQDAMPHLYDSKVGKSMGRLDFLAGHLHRELFTSFGYPLERLLPVPVAVDEGKFHPGPVRQELLRRHECEVAFVSHHSETPEAMHARLVSETANNPGVQRICERMRPRIREAVDRAMDACVMAVVEKDARAEIEREYGPDADPRLLPLVLRLYGAAMADRIMRHQTLEWAAGACERNGWRLRVYGRGWQGHPRFGTFAAGELAHGEELRACYQAATVNLHASVNTLVHQRVMECALSGGLPVCRMHRDALSGVYSWAQAAACGRGEPTICDVERRLPGYQVADHPELISALFQIQRLGVENRSLGCLAEARAEVFRREGARIDAESHAGWLLGDLSESTFWSAETLEARIRRAVERPSWRSGVSGMIAGRVRSRLTHGVLVKRLIAMVRGSLDAGAASASLAA